MCVNCKYIDKNSFYNETVYEGTTSERVEVVGYCDRYEQEVWVNNDRCTNYEESEEEWENTEK